MFTNEKKRIDHARAFVAAAVSDGWSIRPMYDDSESVESAATLERDGFKIQAIMRVREGAGSLCEASLSAWGPDRLCIILPNKYDWAEIVRGLKICGECGQEVVETERVGFAGRCCKDCLAAAKKKYEYPGWTN